MNPFRRHDYDAKAEKLVNDAGIPGVIAICNDVYCTTERAKDDFLEKMFAYNIDHSKGKNEVAIPGRWFLKLRETVGCEAAKCRACGGIVDRLGICTHLRQCEHCGSILYREFREAGTSSEDGPSTFRIRFAGATYTRTDWRGLPEEVPDFGTITMKVYAYSNSKKEIYFNAAPLVDERSWSDYGTKDGAAGYLERHKNKYRRVLWGKQELIAVSYDPHDRSNNQAIEISEIRGGQQRFDDVYIYKGKEIEGGRYSPKIPIPQYFHVILWDKEKFGRDTEGLWSAILSAAHLVSREDYYTGGENSHDFDETQFYRMTQFVENFTTIPMDEWLKFLKLCRRNGKGFLRDLKLFCAKDWKYPEKQNPLKRLFGRYLDSNGCFYGQDVGQDIEMTVADFVESIPARKNIFGDKPLG